MANDTAVEYLYFKLGKHAHVFVDTTSPLKLANAQIGRIDKRMIRNMDRIQQAIQAGHIIQVGAKAYANAPKDMQVSVDVPEMGRQVELKQKSKSLTNPQDLKHTLAGEVDDEDFEAINEDDEDEDEDQEEIESEDEDEDEEETQPKRRGRGKK